MSKKKKKNKSKKEKRKKTVLRSVESLFREDQVQIAELHQPSFPDKALQVNVFQKKELYSIQN